MLLLPQSQLLLQADDHTAISLIGHQQIASRTKTLARVVREKTVLSPKFGWTIAAPLQCIDILRSLAFRLAISHFACSTLYVTDGNMSMLCKWTQLIGRFVVRWYSWLAMLTS